LTALSEVVTPVKTGVQIFCKCSKDLDSGFRRNDEKDGFPTFYEAMKYGLAANIPVVLQNGTSALRL